MPDVGVLNLTIQDNSQNAVQGLDNLVGALSRVKGIVNDGLKLSTVASGIRRLATSVNENLTGNTLVKIRNLANELHKLQGLGNLNIRISGGSSVQSIADAVNEARDAMSAINTGFDSYGERAASAGESVNYFNNCVRETEQLMQSTAWGYGIDQFSALFKAWSAFRSQHALSAGEQPALLGEAETGWTLWKDGAIEVEGTVSDATEAINGYLEGTHLRLTGIVEETKRAGQAADNVKEKVENVKPEGFGTGSLEHLIASDSMIGEILRGLKGVQAQWNAIRQVSESTGIPIENIVRQIIEMRERGREAREQIEGLLESLNTPISAGAIGASAIERIQGIGAEAKSAKDSMSAFMQEMQKDNPLAAQVRELNPELQNLNEKLMENGYSANELTADLVGVDGELRKKKQDCEDASKGMNILRSAMDGLKKMFPGMFGLMKQFKNMMKRMIMRSIVRQIISGVKEGVENLYHYSRIVGTSFAPAMDAAATSLQQMKNSIGAMLAPAIQALIPILQTVINYFIQAMNFVNQFFALINGQKTWTRALPESAEAFDNTAKNAKKASKATKDLLADWDELNIIKSQDSGSAGTIGGHTAEEYKNMFEEVSEYNENVKSLVGNINDQFGDTWTLVKRIGAGILLWKASKAFIGTLGSLAGLAGSVIVMDLIFNVSQVFTKNFLETGEKGWLIADILGTLVGGSIARKLLSRVLGGGLASVAIPLSFGISAAATISAYISDTDTSALSEKGILAALTGATEAGVSVGSALFSLGGYNMGASIAGGIGGGLFTFGVAIGLKTVIDTIENGNITQDTILGNITSATFVGAGLALTEMAVGGTAMSVLTLGVGGAIGTLAVLFALEVLIKKEPEKVRWGDYKATKKEIEAFVNERLLKEPPSVKISLINATIEPLGESKTKLTEQASAVIGTLEAVSVGIMTKPDDLRTQINTLVSDFNAASENYQNTLKVALKLAPLTGGNGLAESEGILSRSGKRWGALNEIMTNLGNDLADAYKVAYDARQKGNIDEMAESTIKEITEMMTRVADAIATGQAKAKVAQNLSMQIQNISEDTLQGILDEYRAQRDALIDEMVKIKTESAEGVLAQQYAFEELAKYALKDAQGNVEDETYKYYTQKADEARKDYQRLIANIKKDAEETADELSKTDAMEDLRKFMLDSITNVINTDDLYEALASAGYGDAELLGKKLGSLLLGNNPEAQVHEVQDLVDALLMDLVGTENFGKYRQAIEENVLNYGDLISTELMDNIADTLGLKGRSKERFKEIIAELYGLEYNGNPMFDVPEIDYSQYDKNLEILKKMAEEAEKLRKDIQAAMEDSFLSTPDMLYLNTKYGADKVQQMLKKMGYVIDEDGFTSGAVNPAPVNGHAGVFSWNLGNGFPYLGRPASTEPITEDALRNGVESGVKNANEEQNRLIGELVTLATRIANKQWTLNVSPTSRVGALVVQSQKVYDKVTG